MSTINITITGPAGSGKTTIADRVERCLDGMMYDLGQKAEPAKVIRVGEGMTEAAFKRMAAGAARVVAIREEDERRPALVADAAPQYDTYNPEHVAVELNGERLPAQVVDGELQVASVHEETWSTNGEEYWADSLDELLSNTLVDAGDIVYRGTKMRPDPADFIDVDTVLEHMDDAAYNYAGEFAEDYTSVVTTEGRAELKQLLQAWARKHAQPNFFLVEDAKKYTVTAEDVARAKGGEA